MFNRLDFSVFMWESLGVYVIDLSTATAWWALQKWVLNRLAVITGSDIILPFPSFKLGLWAVLFKPASSRTLLHGSLGLCLWELRCSLKLS